MLRRAVHANRPSWTGAPVVALVLVLIGLVASPASAALAGSTWTASPCAVRGGAVACGGASDTRGNGIRYGAAGMPIFAPDVPTKVVGIDDALSVSASGNVACAVRAGGRVACWGYNYSAALGHGPGGPLVAVTPQEVPGLSGVTQISIGGSHVCALAEARVVCWGDDSSGQSGGRAAGPIVADPTPVPRLGPALAVSATSSRTCAALVVGTVWCWGADQDGSLGTQGLGTTDERALSPLQVPGITDATGISSFGQKTCVSRASGSVWCWGRFSAEGEPTPQERIDGVYRRPTAVGGIGSARQVSVSMFGACAVEQDGHVRCWGDGLAGELGTIAARSATARTVRGLSDAVAVDYDIAMPCALRANGQTVCWGSGAAARAADPLERASSTSTPVQASGISGATAIAQGYGPWCAVLASGAASCTGFRFGDDGGEHIDDDVTGATPRVLAGLTDATAVVTGASHLCALRAESGKVVCQGTYARTRYGDPIGPTELSRVPIYGGGGEMLEHVVQLAGGAGHACALRDDHAVFCWGNAEAGQTGVNGWLSADGPALRVSNFSDVTQIAARADSSCALRSGGEVLCWGEGVGQTAGPEYPLTYLPKAVALREPASQLRSSGTGFCATLAGGSEQCWLQDRSLPAAAVTCALAAGTVRCVGDGSGGLLGVGTERFTYGRSVPLVQLEDYVTATIPADPPTTPGPQLPVPDPAGPPAAAPAPRSAPTPPPTTPARVTEPRPATVVFRSTRAAVGKKGLQVTVTFAPSGPRCPTRAKVSVLSGKRVLVRARVRVKTVRPGLCSIASKVSGTASLRTRKALRVRVVAGSGTATVAVRRTR